MFNIFINDYNVNSKHQWTVLQICVLNNIEIPRFCYHEKLSIAGNCRMCLIEEIKQLKPIVSCSILISNNMYIYTNTIKVKKSRESVLEFLLINHPLDCPICDQAGECDLQDQSLIFGNDRGRFYEYKRSVENKDCGVFVKTIMNRCIHCTRCVRFVNEYLDGTLGVTGRGMNMEIGFYLDHIINVEFIGNIIDLCPVGALTSKPYAFLTRPWELKSINSFDIFDSFNSNIRFDIRGTKILRVLPKINDLLNEEWISDKVRFNYDGLRLQRLITPLYNNNNIFIKFGWQKILILLKKKFIDLLNLIVHIKSKFLFLKNFFCDYLDLETIIFLKLFSNKFNFNYNFENQLNNDFLLNFHYNVDYNLLFNSILLNLNLRLSMPNLHLKFKNLYYKKEVYFYYIGFFSNFLFYIHNLGINISILLYILEGLHWICNKLYSKNLINYIFYNTSINCLNFDKLTVKYITFQKILLNSIDYNLSIISLNNYKKNIFKHNNYVFYNLGFNERKINYSINSLQIYQGIIGDMNTLNSNIILPATSFIEKTTSYFNFAGLYQKLNLILSKLGESKDDWQIIKIISFYLGNYLNKIEFKKYYFNNYFLFNKKLYKKIINNEILFIFYNNIFNSYQNFYYNDIFSKSSKNINLHLTYLQTILNLNFKI